VALLEIVDELDRAAGHWPFSNGYEMTQWSDIWCAECVHYETCPLLIVVLHGKTPAPWELREHGALNRYTCHEFTRKDAIDEAAALLD